MFLRTSSRTGHFSHTEPFSMVVSAIRRFWSAAAIGLLLLTVPITAAAGTGAHKLDLHLQQQLKRGSGNERVIVRTKTGQRAAVVRTLQQHGHAAYSDHPGIEALSVEVSADTLRALANNPAVESISIDA